MTQSAELSKRTPEEIFAHHAQALGAEDLDATELDYADSAYLVTPSNILHGKPAIRAFFAGVFQALPQAQWGVKTTYVDRKSTRLNSSHTVISYAVFCLKKKKKTY